MRTHMDLETGITCPATMSLDEAKHRIRDQQIKADEGKLRLELIPMSAIRSLGRVLTYGAKKYSDNSWQRVERERYVGAIMRHLMAYIDDPLGVDEESGLLHIEHVLCNAAFLNDMAKREIDGRLQHGD